MNYKFVNYRWDESVASKLDPVGRLIYRSNQLGSDQRITNTGGGNTSSKVLERDPLTGDQVEVLEVLRGNGSRFQFRHPGPQRLGLIGRAGAHCL